MKERKVNGSSSPTEIAAIFTAVLAIPFYLGLVHWPAPQMLLYSGAASAAMTTGGFMETPERRNGGFRIFLMDMALWFAIIIPVGGAAYLIALIF